jgi:hypothetical protein
MIECRQYFEGENDFFFFFFPLTKSGYFESDLCAGYALIDMLVKSSGDGFSV